MRALATASLLALLALAPSGAQAQELRQFTQRLTLAWARNDAGAIANFTAPRGVSVDLDGQPLGPIASRQVSALLKRHFDEAGETVSVTLTNAKDLPGNPARAYVELIWVHRPRGTTIPERVKVFVALIVQDGAWRITEIRQLP